MSETFEPINLKFGMGLACREVYQKNMKLGQKAYVGSRDPFFKFWDPLYLRIT